MRLMHERSKKANKTAVVKFAVAKSETKKRAPLPPRELKKEGKKFWKEVVAQLEREVYTDKVAQASLLTLCVTYQDWVDLSAIVAEEGLIIDEELANGAIKKTIHPAARMRAETAKRLRILLADFGLAKAKKKAQGEETAVPGAKYFLD